MFYSAGTMLHTWAKVIAMVWLEFVAADVGLLEYTGATRWVRQCILGSGGCAWWAQYLY